MANRKLKLQAELRDGTVVVPPDHPAPAHPLAEFVGMFKDDPLIEEWKKSMKAYRRKRDKDADNP